MKVQVRARIRLYQQVFETLVAADAWVILRGVNKPGLLRRYGDNADHPHRVTMSHLIERVDTFCKSTRGEDEHALLVADEHHETQSVLLRALVVFQERGTWGYLAKRSTVVDTIHFVNSTTNPLIQGADMVVFLARRWLTQKEPDPRAQRAVDALQATEAAASTPTARRRSGRRLEALGRSSSVPARPTAD